MTKLVTLDTLPLYADDLAIGAAVLGSARGGEWKAIAPLLESKGLPKIDKLHGGRFVPAVKAFYSAFNGIVPLVPAAPDGVEHPDTWTKNAQKRRA